MPLVSSGNLSLSDLITEFAAPAGSKLRDFLRNGLYVGDISANAGIPTSGTLTLRNFLGAMRAVCKITNTSVSRFSGTTAANAVAGYRLNTSGVAEKRTGAAYATYETWRLVGASSAYDCRFTLQSGTTPTGTLNTWMNLATSREISLQDANPGIGGVTCTILVEIRHTTGQVIDNAVIILDSELDTA